MEEENGMNEEVGYLATCLNCYEGEKTLVVPRGYSKLAAVDPELGIERIVLHEGVRSINPGSVSCKVAFVVDEGNPYLSSENGLLYSKDKTVLLRVPTERSMMGMRLSSKLLHIGESAFSGVMGACIGVPDGVISVGERAFAHCPELVYLYLPDTVTIVGEHAFYGDDELILFCEAKSMPRGYAFSMSEVEEIRWNWSRHAPAPGGPYEA